MNRFAALFAALDGTTRTSVKTEALADYFRTAPEADRVWTIALLTGRRPRRAVTSTELRLWAAEAAGVPVIGIGCHHPDLEPVAAVGCNLAGQPVPVGGVHDTGDRTLDRQLHVS